ncbi:MAG: hypothetical protein WA867_12480 [Candidatus Acidiferrales bacterium]
MEKSLVVIVLLFAALATGGLIVNCMVSIPLLDSLPQWVLSAMRS